VRLGEVFRLQDIASDIDKLRPQIGNMHAGDQAMRFAATKRRFHALNRGHRLISGNAPEDIGNRLLQSLGGVGRIGKKQPRIRIHGIDRARSTPVILDNRPQGRGEHFRIKRAL